MPFSVCWTLYYVLSTEQGNWMTRVLKRVMLLLMWIFEWAEKHLRWFFIHHFSPVAQIILITYFVVSANRLKWVSDDFFAQPSHSFESAKDCSTVLFNMKESNENGTYCEDCNQLLLLNSIFDGHCCFLKHNKHSFLMHLRYQPSRQHSDELIRLSLATQVIFDYHTNDLLRLSMSYPLFERSLTLFHTQMWLRFSRTLAVLFDCTILLYSI